MAGALFVGLNEETNKACLDGLDKVVDLSLTVSGILINQSITNQSINQY